MMEKSTIELSGWGGYPRVKADVISPRDLSEVESAIAGGMLMRGQGRSYGDAAISDVGTVVLSDHLNKLVTLDESGLLVAEAGLTIDEVLRTSVSNGWFPAVVPGTRFVSLGGCFAADIHGKNHHRDGSFSQHVKEFELVLADRSRKVCSATSNSDLFWATAGGMGLTGIISNISMRMRKVENSLVVAQYQQSPDLESSLNILTDKELDDEYSVVWIDCLAKGAKLGRGILMRAHHARQDELPSGFQAEDRKDARQAFDLKFDFPSGVLNRFSVAAFNEIYYRLQGSRRRPFIQHYDDFFFPLDKIGSWNRMYGKRGFVQYQCVLPLKEAAKGMQSLLAEVARSKRASFLAVLKMFGPANEGLLSFPLEGYTITLDFALSDGLLPFLDRLDEIVVRFGGRVYLAKDARLQPENFRKMYSRLDEWLDIKTRVDPTNRFESSLARRLELVSNSKGSYPGAG